MSTKDGLSSIREELEQIRKSKASTGRGSRRYSKKEKAVILEASKVLENWEVEKLSGARGPTVAKWKRRVQLSQSPVDPSSGQASYSGHHQHWQLVVDLWKSKPGLGPTQISNQLKRQGHSISVSTVRSILEENGYTLPSVVEKEERIFRYEAARPRELVHLDFKHFYINKQKVFLLLMQDDYSRFLCGYKITDSENIDAVIEVFENCIASFGRMQMIMTDAGSAFYSWNGVNRFQKLVGDEYGIEHIKAGSPRSNGKVESVNKQIEKELLRVKEFSSLEEADMGVGEWIEFYNFERTHMGLPQSEVPADRFLFGWNKKARVASRDDVWEELLKVAVKKIK